MYRFLSSKFSDHYQEKDLEDWLQQNPTVLTDGEPILIISRQPSTPYSGTPDLIALDADGNTVLIELKGTRPPRDVIAQALEYTAWLAALSSDEVRSLAQNHFAKSQTGRTFEETWQNTFNIDSDEETTIPILNTQQRTIIVAEGNDERIESVVRYLHENRFDIHLLAFRFFQEADQEYLDFEQVVGGELEISTKQTSPVRYSESNILSQWAEIGKVPFYKFKEILLNGDPQIVYVPMKSSFSFYKNTRDGRVFIGTYETYSNSIYFGFRRDSLRERIDIDESILTIKRRVPKSVIYRENSNGASFGMKIEASEAEAIAQIVLEEIVLKIE